MGKENKTLTLLNAGNVSNISSILFCNPRSVNVGQFLRIENMHQGVLLDIGLKWIINVGKIGDKPMSHSSWGIDEDR